MAIAEKVAFAETAITVHVKRASEPSLLPDGEEVWDVESKIMLPGEIMSLSEMPPYLSDAVKGGHVAGLKALTPTQAKQRTESYNEIMGLSSPAEATEQEEDSEFPPEEI